jgi:O-antigen/teichoic acid export membrane protein
MSLVAKQSIYNFITITLAFILGAINTLYLYPSFPGKAFQGLVVALLATSNLIQPFVSFGVQHALIKFYSSYDSQKDKDSLLWFSLLFPLIILSILIPFLWTFTNEILAFLTQENQEMSNYPIMIISISILTAYFEIFFSWLRIKLKTVFGNFLKEFYPRLLIFSLLIIYLLKIIDVDQFIELIVLGYAIRLLIIISYSFWIYTPTLKIRFPKKIKSILKYNLLIFLSGAAASFILDIDKSMIYSMLKSENVAYYIVALFIATVVEAPGRGLFQILSPLVAKAINENNISRLESLLKKSSINLLIICGFVFVIINSNLIDLYEIVNQDGYANAIGVVWIVSVGKLFTMSMGCINNIISNSKFYPYVFWFSISSAVMAIFMNLILIKSHGIIGAAYATLGVIVFINLCKLTLVRVAFKIHPYNTKSIYSIVLIFAIYAILSILKLNLTPINSIILKSIIGFLIFTFFTIKMKLSKDIIFLYEKLLKRLF